MRQIILRIEEESEAEKTLDAITKELFGEDANNKTNKTLIHLIESYPKLQKKLSDNYDRERELKALSFEKEKEIAQLKAMLRELTQKIRQEINAKMSVHNSLQEIEKSIS